MMVRSIRSPLLCSVTAVLVVGAPLRAQRVDVGTSRRSPRAEAGDANGFRLHRLQRQADSLAQLYSDGEDLSGARRRAVGEELDRTVEQIDALTRRMAAASAPIMRMRVQVAPMIDERDATAMSNALRQAEAGQLAMPRGWMGVLISGTARESRIENGELIIHYLTHPVILSVDPSSPAEKAGITPGDTLVAYDGRDVRDRDISLTRLVRPNARVLVRIRRDGRTREVPVTIADAPSRFRLRTEATYVLRAPRAPEAPGFARAPLPAAAMEPMAALRAMPAMPPMPVGAPPAPTPAMIADAGLTTVAGAQLVALTDGLARTVGVRRGVLVTNAAVGSPAYDSELRDGDVIVRVGGVPVRTVAEVREQVQTAWNNGDVQVELDCVRERKARKVMLRWGGR
jgi:serine protease Do